MVTSHDELFSLGEVAPANLLEQIKEAQREAASTIEAATARNTTDEAIASALSVAGIHEPSLKAEGDAMLAKELPLLLHLAAESFLIRRESPGLHFYDALREAIESREAHLRHWRIYPDAAAMMSAFKDWLRTLRMRLTERIDGLEDEISNLAPLAKTVREQAADTDIVAYYNALCAALVEAKSELALIEANADLTQFEGLTELSNSSDGALLLWERFVGG